MLLDNEFVETKIKSHKNNELSDSTLIKSDLYLLKHLTQIEPISRIKIQSIMIYDFLICIS